MSFTPIFRASRLAAVRLSLGFSFAPVAALAVGTFACSSDAQPAPGPQAAPKWSNAPSAALVLKQGVAAPIPVQFDRGFEVTEVVATGATGVSASFAEGKLWLVADYTIADEHKVNISFRGAGGVEATGAVTLKVRELSWLERVTWRDEGPQTREHASTFVDAEAREVFLLQGTGYSPQWKPIADNWRYNLDTKAWSKWEPTGDVPEPGYSRRVAQVGNTPVFYAYGGGTGFQDTEKEDGNAYRVDVRSSTKTFTKLTQENPPPARTLHGLGFDSALGVGVVFGGFSGEQQRALRDTWTFKVEGDTVKWTELKPPTSPTARYGFFSAVDEVTHTFYVWSGAQQPKSSNPVNPAQDLWALSLGDSVPTWKLIETSGTAPMGRRNGCTMHDPVGRRLFVFGGTPDGRVSVKGLSVLDLRPGHHAWTVLDKETPPSRSSGSGFFDSKGELGYCGFGNDDAAYRDWNVVGHK